MSPCSCLLPDLGQPCASVYPRAAATQGRRRNHRGCGEQTAPQSLQMGALTSQCRESTKPLRISPYPPPPPHLPPRLQPCREGHSAFPELQEKKKGGAQKNPTGHIPSKGSSPLTSPEENFKAGSGAAAAHPHQFAAPQRGGIAASRRAAAALREVTTKTLRSQRPPYH